MHIKRSTEYVQCMMTGESRPRINTLSTPQSALWPSGPAEKRTIIGYSTKTAIWYRLKYESAPSIQELCRMPRHSDACYAKCPTWKLALPDAVSKVWPLLMDAVQNTPSGTVAEACGVYFMISLVCLLSQQS